MLLTLTDFLVLLIGTICEKTVANYNRDFLNGFSGKSVVQGFLCPGDGKWPHELNCESYYECVGGEASLHHCRDNLLFDLRYYQCNFPEGVDCGDRIRPTGPPVTTSTTTTTTTTQAPPSETPITEIPITTTTTTTSTTTTTTTTTPSPTFETTRRFDFDCPSPEGNFPDPEDCSAFYICLNNIAISHQYCPPDLLFNRYLQNCDYPWNVDCPNE